MKIKIPKKVLLIFFLSINLINSTKNVQVIRDFTRDYLYCPNEVNCPKYDAQQITPMECGCYGGSFVRDGNILKCKTRQMQTNKGKFKC